MLSTGVAISFSRQYPPSKAEIQKFRDQEEFHFFQSKKLPSEQDTIGSGPIVALHGST